jgi:hypothetical protein
MTSHSEEYTNQLSLAEKLGKPIAQLDASNLSKAIEAMKEAEATTEATKEATTEAEATKEAVLVS